MKANECVKGAGVITPSEHEKAEWSRLADDAYGRNLNEFGFAFDDASVIPPGAVMPLRQFDRLQSTYRQWLISGELSWEAL